MPTTYLPFMCVLYSLRRASEEIRHLLNYMNQHDFAPRDYVTPGSPQAIARRGADGTRELALVRWGFVPSWAKEMPPGRPQVNARSETIYEKPTFKNAIRRRRCLIPADGWYEWQGDAPGRKQAWYLHRAEGQPFALGGIWEHWMGADGSELDSSAMLTTHSGMPVAAIHERSPVVIMPEDYERWLSADEEQVQDLLKPPPDDFWTMQKTIIARPRKPEAPPPAPPIKSQMDLL